MVTDKTNSSSSHGHELTLIASLDHAIALAGELGLAPEKFFSSIGYRPDQHRRYTPRVPLRVLSRFLTWAAEASSTPSFGLKAGARVGPRDLGAYGYLLLNSPTLGEAMTIAIRFADFPQQGGALDWKLSSDGFLEIRYDAHGLEERYRRQDAECTLAIVLSVWQKLAGQTLYPTEVRVQHDPAKQSARLEDHFHCPAIYSDRDNALRFDTAVLSLPIRGHDPQLLSILTSYVEQELQALPPPEDELGRVRWAIRRGLSAGHMNVASVSRMCQVNQRTLQRHLSLHGTSFAETVDQVRQELLEELTTASNISQREIADRLGFCDASALAKARKRWVRSA